MTPESGLQGYGYVSDNDEGLTSKTRGKFGLNQNSTLFKFAFNANVAKDGEAPRAAIEIEVHVQDGKYLNWVSPITKVYGKDNEVLTDPTSPEYIKSYNEAINQQMGLVTHYLKAVGVSEEAIKNALTASPITGFADYAQRVCALLPADYNKKLVDVFLEYQWKIGTKADGTENERTFPTLPSNMKGGYFIVPAQGGTYNEVRDNGDLKYVNQSGTEHPISKTKDFMESNKGTQQVKGQAPGTPGNEAFTPGNGEAQASTWGQASATGAAQ